MKNAIARLGLLSLLSLFTSPGFAYSVSDLLISEVMANPVALSDARGEWFELYNPTDQQINLRETWLGDDGGNLHRFDTDLLILPAQYLTLARSPSPGFIPGYVYDGFTLANGADEIVFGDLSGELLRLDYHSGFVMPGQSMELIGEVMRAQDYVPTPVAFSYGEGDAGTPGSAGSFRFGAASVPAPGSAWLLVGAMLALAFARKSHTAGRLRTRGSGPATGVGLTVANFQPLQREACWR